MGHNVSEAGVGLAVSIRLRNSARVAKHQREKLMFLAVVSNCPGRAKIALIPCEKLVPAKRSSRNRPTNKLYPALV